MSAPTSDCIFCRIIAGEIPSTRVAETATLVAFEDTNPKAPLHVLVVPREHSRDVASLAAEQPGRTDEIAALAQRIADERSGGHFRLVFNTGAEAGQSVFHAHAHVLGQSKELKDSL
jgi:histidine triad (HIT) family protein